GSAARTAAAKRSRRPEGEGWDQGVRSLEARVPEGDRGNGGEEGNGGRGRRGVDRREEAAMSEDGGREGDGAANAEGVERHGLRGEATKAD
ncbi:unnamed protein product, partial [Musa hybrid cultivar]